MGQGEILDLIEQSKRPLKAKGISKRLDISGGSVATALKKLRDKNEIGWKMEKKITYIYFKKS